MNSKHGKSRLINRNLAFPLLIFAFLPLVGSAQSIAKEAKPRIVITCDPELDDNNSLIRFLLFSNELDVQGLIYASSGYHWKGDGKGTKWYVPGREYTRFGLDTCPCASWRWDKDERFIDNAVEAYAKVYPNLRVHDPEYPLPEVLKSKIRFGNIEFDGDFSKNTAGSDLIKSLILDDQPGKLYITAWGGQSTIARALKSIQEQYEFTTQWEAIKNKIARKVVLLPSGDQDDTYAKYIKPNWPDIEYREFKNGSNYGFGAQLHAKPADSLYFTATWMKANVSSRGPLGALYRVWGDGKQMVKGDKLDFFGLSGYTMKQLKSMGYVVWMPLQEKGSWIGEGDDFTYMNMPANGLRAYEDGTYGGWGGCVVNDHSTSVFALPAGDTSQQVLAAAISSANAQRIKEANSYPDFFPAAQQDFAARMKWSVSPNYADANHPPLVVIEGPLNVLASPGETIKLTAKVADPDGNTVSVKWWQFQVGTYTKTIAISDPAALQTKIIIPKDALPGQTIHIIFEATDNGVPALTRYQRVIIKIRD